MQMRQKLDILILEDKYNLSAPELLKRAEHALQEETGVNGWESIQVVVSVQAPEQSGEFLRHTFEVYGIETDNAQTAKIESAESQSVTIKKSAAAPDANI